MIRPIRGRCAVVRARLPLFVGDDLPPDVAHELRLHLRDCAACRGLASSQLQAARALHRLGLATELPGVDEPFFVALHGDIMAAVAGAGGSARAAGRARAIGRRAALALAAAVLFALGLGLAGAFVGGEGRGLVGRAPVHIPTEAGGGTKNGAAPVVWTQGRLQPLGQEVDLDSTGLGLRQQLRTLEREFILPAAWRVPEAAPPATLPRAAVPDDGKPRSH